MFQSLKMTNLHIYKFTLRGKMCFEKKFAKWGVLRKLFLPLHRKSNSDPSPTQVRPASEFWKFFHYIFISFTFKNFLTKQNARKYNLQFSARLCRFHRSTLGRLQEQESEATERRGREEGKMIDGRGKMDNAKCLFCLLWGDFC